MAQKEVRVKSHTRRTKTGSTQVQSYDRTMTVKEQMLKRKNEAVEFFDIKRRKLDLAFYKKKIEKLPQELKEQFKRYFEDPEKPAIAPAKLKFQGGVVGLQQVPSRDMALKIMFNSKWKTVQLKNGDISKVPDITNKEWLELIRQNGPIVSWSINNLQRKMGKNLDRDTKESLRAAGTKAIFEAVVSYAKNNEPKNPKQDLTNTIFSTVRGTIMHQYNKERASLMNAIGFPQHKIKHFSKFSKLYKDLEGTPHRMEEMHKLMGLKKKDLYSDLRGTPEGEELLPMEGYTSDARKEAVAEKVKIRDARIQKEEESFRAQVGLLKNRLQGTVSDEDKAIVSTGVSTINKNIASMVSMLNSKMKNNGTGSELAEIRQQIKNLKEAKSRLQESVEPIDLNTHKRNLDSLIEGHNKRLELINELYNEDIRRSNIGGFEDLYNFMEGLMGVKPYELDKFTNEEEDTKQDEIIDIGGEPSAEQMKMLKEAHAYNVAQFKAHLNYLPELTKKVIQLHLGIDKHSPVMELKPKQGESKSLYVEQKTKGPLVGVGELPKLGIWGEPIDSARRITEHLNQLVKDGKVKPTIFGTGEVKTEHSDRIRRWQNRKPEKEQKVKISVAEQKKQKKKYDGLRKKAQDDHKKWRTKNPNASSLDIKKNKEQFYKKYEVEDGNNKHKSRAFILVPNKSYSSEMKRWQKSKPQSEDYSQKREKMVNDQLKMAKKLVELIVPENISQGLIRTQRAIQSFNITKANLKDELRKGIKFQAFFDKFNYDMSKVNEDGTSRNTGIGIDYFVTGRSGNKVKRTYYPTVDQLVTGVSLVPTVFYDTPISQKLEDFLAKKHFSVQRANGIRKAMYDFTQGDLLDTNGNKIESHREAMRHILLHVK